MVQKETKRSIKSANTQHQIIESARQLMRQYGYENTSIQQICQAAKVSTGTFYHFFPSKHDLLKRVVADVSGSHREGEELDYGKDSPYKLAENFSAACARLVRSLSPEAMFGVFFLSPNGNKLFYSKEHPTYTYLTTALSGFQQAGKLRGDISVEEMYMELFSCHLGMLYSCYTTGTMDALQEKLEKILKHLISTYIVPEKA